MNKMWAFVREFDAGDWIAALVVGSLSIWVLWHTTGNLWNVVAGSLQPALSNDLSSVADQYDLVAQRSMSAAAWWMVILTSLSLAVGTISVVLLKMNFDEARKVTTEAARSAKAAEDAVLAAREATDATARMGKVQVRAFIGMGDVKINIEGPEVTVTYKLLNSGQSPAYSLVVLGRARVWADGKERSVTAPAPESLHMIRTAGSEDYHTVFKIEPKRFTDKLEVMTEIRISYRDVFDDRHIDAFTHKHSFQAGSAMTTQRLMEDVLGSMV